ncbi:MAG TPA: phospholipase D-like domain-containing protein [Clostridia bacterium]|nr:phospholipase D-like domain-containing protein [Clostridia bacterium]
MKRARQLVLLVVICVSGLAYWGVSQRPASVRELSSVAESGSLTAETRYSPGDNLERLDLARLGEAQQSIDIAMYAFTDTYIADALVDLAERGVEIRIYRDHQQFEDEQRRFSERGKPSTTALFAGQKNIQVRVKNSHELMHLKAFLTDGRVLRDGSANWSPTGLKRQDNNAHYTADPLQVNAFRRNFEQMWERPDNLRVQ